VYPLRLLLPDFPFFLLSVLTVQWRINGLELVKLRIGSPYLILPCVEYLWQVNNVSICSGGARNTIKTSCLHVGVLDIAKNLLKILSE
jgi:hypothetical protein